MAPSPTGFLHIGGVRTFLFNWLFARHEGGEFRLRIENTDTSREVAEAVDQIEASLRWLGLDWDGPTTFQLDRMDDCREVAQRLVAEGKAYEDEGAIRFRMPDDGVTAWDDAVRGRVEVPNETIEDVVIVRSDGRPTYNFASPMEDVWDGITHVIRAEDHISNTPKQINIIGAVGAELPVYAHVPNVNGPDGKKLSKRHGATGVDEFRKSGYLPDALLNFLALLGWAPDGETTIMSRDELVARFGLDRVSSSPAQFDYAKLDWMNGVYMRAMSADDFAHALVLWLGEQGYEWDAELVRKAAPLVQEKIQRLDEFPGFAGFLFHDVEPDPAALDGGAPVVAAARDALAGAGAVHGRGDRGGAPRRARGPRPEAAAGIRADPGRRHGLQGLSGAVREHRAARPRDDAAAARRRGGFGLARPLHCRPVATAAKKSHTVLIVDDEYAIRFLCRVNLELDGYRVLEAAEVAEARRLLETEQIDVVLLDLNVGPERTDDLLEELRRRTPPMPVALVTGSTDVLAPARPEADAVLAKPFEVDELAETVRRLTALTTAER